MIVIVDHDKVSQLQMTCCTCSLAGNTLHGATISEKAVCVIGDQVEARLVEYGGSMSLCDSEADCVGKSLAERSSRNFNARYFLGLRMTWGFAIYLLLLFKQRISSPQLV